MSEDSCNGECARASRNSVYDVCYRNSDAVNSRRRKRDTFLRGTTRPLADLPARSMLNTLKL